MQLTLFRHGIAQVRDGVTPDADRKLTPKGVRRTELSLIGLATCCMDVSLIITSPKVRAQQTADIASEVLNVPVLTEQSLAQEKLTPILQMIKQYDENHLMLVGHEPTFTELAEYLCGKRPVSEHGQRAMGYLILKKAGAMSLQIERHGTRLNRPAQMQWLLPPVVLRALGKKESLGNP